MVKELQTENKSEEKLNEDLKAQVQELSAVLEVVEKQKHAVEAEKAEAEQELKTDRKIVKLLKDSKLLRNGHIVAPG